MRFSSFAYLVKQGWKNMGHNRLMTLASVGVLTACFIITGIAALLALNVNKAVDYLAGQNEIMVNLKMEVDDLQAEAIGDAIRQIPNVNTVTYVSRQDALTFMTDMLEDSYGNIMDGIDPAIFPPKYVVTVDDIDFIDTTTQRLAATAGVERVYVSNELTDVMLTIRAGVTYGGGGIVAILLVVSIIVISNTIRLTVFARRREISIMKYVGATNGFIRLPFFVEGVSVGVLAGLLASGAVCGAYYLVYNYLHDMYNVWVMGMMSSFLTLGDIWVYIVLVFVGAGAVLGGFGTATSVKKHLKV